VLNEAQHRAVIVPGHCLISACPGAGKTTVLSHRAAHLLKMPKSGNVGAVTFTSEAAADLVRRIREKAPGEERRIRAGTFHKLAKDQLASAGKRITLISDRQCRGLVMLCIKEADSDADLEECLSYIQLCKSHVHPAKLRRNADADPHPDLEEIYCGYEAALKERRIHDFQDLLILAVQGMRDKTVRPLDVSHLLVDEAQDADELQWAWIMEHVGVGCMVTAVGDDDQTIYGWRHASGFRGMQTFLDKTNAAYVALDTTYRCAPEILRHASLLIAHNKVRLPKSLVTANTWPGVVRSHPAATRKIEVAAIVGAVQSANWAEWAILARTNAALDAAENAFDVSAINCRRIGGASVWDKPAAALYLSVLGSFSRGDLLGIEGLLQAMKIPSPTLKSIIKELQPSRPGSLHRFINHSLDGLGDGTSVGKLQSICREWEPMVAQKVDLLTTVVQDWIDRFLPLGTIPGERGPRYLESRAESITRRSGTLAQRLVKILQKTDADSVGVTLVTCHGCKGLEFDRVWTMACEEGVMPDERSDLEEERRLLYVAMTRARKELVISGLQNDKTGMSRFLEEAGFPSAIS
jgi:DNA helicase-2/ATP-dependent DNA helicase PcrA